LETRRSSLVSALNCEKGAIVYVPLFFLIETHLDVIFRPDIDFIFVMQAIFMLREKKKLFLQIVY